MKKMHYRSRKNTRSGFLLVETLVAIGLLLIAVPAALDSVSRGIASSSYAKNEMIATYLAQEGLEIVRLQRDDNMLNVINTNGDPATWDAFIDPSFCGGANGCVVDPIAATVSVCGSGCTGQLYTDANGIYSLNNSGNPTMFFRHVTVASVPGTTNEIKVTSTVNFISSYGARSIVVKENLYNWLQPS